MGTGSFQRVKSGRGVTLTSHPLLVPWSWKGRAVPLLPLWTVQPVQSHSGCTRVTFTFTSFLFNLMFYCLVSRLARNFLNFYILHLLFTKSDKICVFADNIFRLPVFCFSPCVSALTVSPEEGSSSVVC